MSTPIRRRWSVRLANDEGRQNEQASEPVNHSGTSVEARSEARFRRDHGDTVIRWVRQLPVLVHRGVFPRRAYPCAFEQDSFADGKLSREAFEGELDGDAYHQMVNEAQRQMVRSLSWFLPWMPRPKVGPRD